MKNQLKKFETKVWILGNSPSVEVEDPSAAEEDHLDQEIGHCHADEGSVGEEPEQASSPPARLSRQQVRPTIASS